MAREVDIWWDSDGKKLKASLKRLNKRGRISFTLVPAHIATCIRCPFMNNPICSKWGINNREFSTGHLCSTLWVLPGDNNFKGRYKMIGWQPLGPLGNEKKNKG